MKKYLAVLVVLIASCSEDGPPGECQTGFKQAVSSSEKLEMLTVSADDKKVILTLGNFVSKRYPEAKGIADSALHIASVLLSSAEFKEVISGFTFTCRNYKNNCSKNCAKCTDRFAGKVVLDSLYRKERVRLDLHLRKCGNEFGHATFNVLEIYSCQSVVFYDERKLSPAHCYAYHLAHEYMHIVGFFHTDHVDDVAEKTGWIGWELILKWKQQGKDLMKLQPGDL